MLPGVINKVYVYLLRISVALPYKSKYTPKNPKKYKGDVKGIVARSSWERTVFRWLDHNKDIKYWASEEFFIPYICSTDGRKHKYYPDVYFETVTGRKILVEIKPKKQVSPPKSKRRTRQSLNEAATYAKNLSKWSAAKEFCEYNGIEWQIWTEDTLKSMGIKIIT